MKSHHITPLSTRDGCHAIKYFTTTDIVFNVNLITVFIVTNYFILHFNFTESKEHLHYEVTFSFSIARVQALSHLNHKAHCEINILYAHLHFVISDEGIRQIIQSASK